MKTFKDTRAENRISLLYELDIHSPIFARIASSEIEKGNLENAKEILQTGILHHPNYATAHFLIAKVHAKLGNAGEAKYSLNIANEILGNDQSFLEYSKIIDDESISYFDESEDRGSAFLPEDYNELNDDPFTSNFDNESSNENDEVLDELESLAHELENAKMPPVNDDEMNFGKFDIDDEIENNDIITETMANIYVEQRRFSEAISIYEKLIEKQPEKETYFKIRIEEIRQSEGM